MYALQLGKCSRGNTYEYMYKYLHLAVFFLFFYRSSLSSLFFRSLARLTDRLIECREREKEGRSKGRRKEGRKEGSRPVGDWVSVRACVRIFGLAFKNKKAAAASLDDPASPSSLIIPKKETGRQLVENVEDNFPLLLLLLLSFFPASLVAYCSWSSHACCCGCCWEGACYKASKVRPRRRRPHIIIFFPSLLDHIHKSK